MLHEHNKCVSASVGQAGEKIVWADAICECLNVKSLSIYKFVTDV